MIAATSSGEVPHSTALKPLERFSKQLISRFAKPQTSGVWLPTTIQKRRGFSKYQFFCKLL
jgi:hypothetical protein